MRWDNLESAKVKCVCADFPNLALLTKSTTLGDTQVAFGYASVGNKSLRKTVTAFALAGSLEYPMAVSIDADISFVITGNKICLPVTEVLLCAAAISRA